MQIVRVFKPQTERKNFFGVGVGVRNSGHRQSGSSKNFEREEARKHENRERTPPVLSSTSSSRFVYEEAWEEDFDEHSQQ
jgi:hypothetical protein